MQPQGINSNTKHQSEGKQQGQTAIYMREKQKPQWQTDPTENIYNRNITVCTMVMVQATPTHWRHAQKTICWHKKDATKCNPMQGSQNNKACVWNKV